jgi:hypothetical protein
MLTRTRAILICAGAVLVAAAVCIAVLVAMAGAKAPVSAAGSVVSQTESARVPARPSLTAAPAKTAAVSPSPTAAVTVNDNDVPNFSGLDTRGESIIIELYGKWDWTPPPGNARANSIALPPGQQLTYTVSSTDHNSTINDVKYWFTAAALGSMEAVYDFNGPYWDCPRPLRDDGQGFSLPATNLPPIKRG